jgi:hypothetical protein
MSGVFLRSLFVNALVIVLDIVMRRIGGRSFDCLELSVPRGLRVAGVLVMMVRIIVIVRMLASRFMVMSFVIMSFVIMTFRMIMMFRVGAMLWVVRMIVLLVGRRRVDRSPVDHFALDAFAMASSARVAMARPAAMIGAVFAFFLGFAMGSFVRLDQGLTIGNRNLVIVGMNFAEGEEAVAVAAIFDKGRLQ